VLAVGYFHYLSAIHSIRLDLQCFQLMSNVAVWPEFENIHVQENIENITENYFCYSGTDTAVTYASVCASHLFYSGSWSTILNRAIIQIMQWRIAQPITLIAGASLNGGGSWKSMDPPKDLWFHFSPESCINDWQQIFFPKKIDIYCVNCTKFGQFQENHSYGCLQMSHFKAEMHQIWFRLGLCPRPHWGSLQLSSRPFSWI